MTENETKLKQLKKLISKPNVEAKLKPIYQMGINKLEQLIAKNKKPSEVEIEEIEEISNMPTVAMPKTTKQKIKSKVNVEKFENPIEYNGIMYDEDSKEFCEILVQEFKERRASSKTKKNTKIKENPLMKNLKKGLVVRFEENKGGRNMSSDMFYDLDTNETILFTETILKSGKKNNREIILSEQEAVEKYNEIKNSDNITMLEFYE